MTRPLLIDTKGDVERVSMVDPRGVRDYLEYAVAQLRAAVDKRDDAPASSAMHEMAARVALTLERVPTYPEIDDAWKMKATDTTDPALAYRAGVADGLTAGVLAERPVALLVGSLRRHLDAIQVEFNAYRVDRRQHRYQPHARVLAAEQRLAVLRSHLDALAVRDA